MTLPLWSCSTRALFGGSSMKISSVAPAPGSTFRAVSPSVLHYDVIDAMAPEDDPWHSSSVLIRDTDSFIRNCRPQHHIPGPLSSLSPELTNSLMDMGIHESRPSNHNEACSVQKLFGVYKDAEHARLIQWPRELNMSTPDLPCALPKRADIHRFISRNAVMDEDDGRDYFYQFELAPGIRKYFAARVSKIGTVYLTRMCMGWKASMAIAQDASNILARNTERLANSRGDCMPYADNFIFGAPTTEDFDAVRKAWSSTIRNANVLTKNAHISPRTAKDCLGLHWDLTRKTLQASKHACEILRTAAPDLKTATFREVFTFFGVCNYARYMMDLPNFRYQNFMLWFRRASTTLAERPHRWDNPAHLPPKAAQSLRRLARDIARPRKVTDSATPHDALLYSDASDSGGGFVICDPATINKGWRWSTAQLRKFPHIHQKEALALVSAVHAAVDILPPGSKILALVDNQVLHWNWSGKKAADPVMANILNELHQTLESKSLTLVTQWIPTHKNIADSLSRLPSPNPAA